MKNKIKKKNRNIADLLSRTVFMEKVGTGIKRIKESCEKNKNSARFKLAKKDFFVIIKSEPLNESLNKVEKRQTLIVNYIKNHKNAKREELVNNLKIPLGTLKRDLIELIFKKIIVKKGSKKTGYYRIMAL